MRFQVPVPPRGHLASFELVRKSLVNPYRIGTSPERNGGDWYALNTSSHRLAQPTCFWSWGP